MIIIWRMSDSRSGDRLGEAVELKPSRTERALFWAAVVFAPCAVLAIIVLVWAVIAGHVYAASDTLEALRNLGLIVAGLLAVPTGLYQLHNATKRTRIQDEDKETRRHQEKNERDRLDQERERLRREREDTGAARDLDRRREHNQRFIEAVKLLNTGLGPARPGAGEDERWEHLVHAPEGAAARLGGIAALERLAKDDPTQTPAIIETLCGFVRQRTTDLRLPKWDSAKHIEEYNPPKFLNGGPRPLAPDRPANDVNAALMALVRIWAEPQCWPWEPVDLRKCWPETNASGTPQADNARRAWPDLRGAILRGLEGAPLIIAASAGGDDARTTCARWLTWGTFLRRANFEKADLNAAALSRAQLRGANLQWAQLHGTYLFEANLADAKLDEAKLHRAHLGGAALDNASLCEAKLHGAHLGGATLNNAKLMASELYGAWLEKTNFEGVIGVARGQFTSALWPVDRADRGPANIPGNIDLNDMTNHIRARWGAKDEMAHKGLNRHLWRWGDDLRYPERYLGPRLPGHPNGACEPNDGWTSEEIEIFAPEGWAADKHPRWDKAAGRSQPFMQDAEEVPKRFMPTDPDPTR